MRKQIVAVLLTLVLGILGISGVAAADSIIPTLTSFGLGTYVYSLTLDALSTVVTNESFITFNAVQGLVSANVGLNADWTTSVGGGNATFTYTGAGADGGATGVTWIGFTLLSTYPTLSSGANIFYNASDVNTETRFTQTNTGYVRGPARTPEPGTLLLLATGLVGLGWVVRAKKTA